METCAFQQEDASEAAAAADIVVVFGLGAARWGGSDRLFTDISDGDCVLPATAEPLLPAGRRRPVVDASVVAAAAFAHVTSRRVVAVVCAGPKEVSLCAYNLELGWGQAPALAHALDAALARATLRRTALMRL